MSTIPTAHPSSRSRFTAATPRASGAPSSPDARPERLDDVVGSMNGLHALAHRPGNELAMQRDHVDVVANALHRVEEELAPLRRIELDCGGVDEPIELVVLVASRVEIALALAVAAVEHGRQRESRVRPP